MYTSIVNDNDRVWIIHGTNNEKILINLTILSNVTSQSN